MSQYLNRYHYQAGLRDGMLEAIVTIKEYIINEHNHHEFNCEDEPYVNSKQLEALLNEMVDLINR